MTQDYGTGLPSDQQGSTAQTAKDQAAGIAQSAAQSGQHLAGEAKTQAAEVGREAGRQAKGILSQGRTQVADQASQGQQKLAGTIRTFGQELSTMAGASEQQGMASQVAGQVSSRVDSVASWLESREPSDILEEVKRYARRSPGTFVLLAAGAGMLAGRLTRGLRDGASSDDDVASTGYRAPGQVASVGYGLQSGTYAAGSGYETGSSYPSGGAYQTAGTTYGTGAAYGATESAGYGDTSATTEYGTAAGEPTYGLQTDQGYGSAAPTTQGSSDDTLAFSTASADPYLDAPDTYGTGTENPPGEATGYEGDDDNPGVYGGGTTEVPEHELNENAAWPPVHGEGEQR